MNLHSPISLDNFILNVSRASGAGITFNQGEILKGQVHEIKDNGLVSIFIKGKLIEAATEIMVNRGQQLFLVVDDMKDGKVVLRVLTPELLNKIENTNIAANLREIGVNADNDNLQMSKKLIQHNLPVTADMLKNMAKAVNLLGGNTPRNLEIVGLAMAKNVPLNQPALLALAQFVEGKPDLASIARELMNILGKLDKLPTEPRVQTTSVNLLPDREPVQSQAPTRNIQIPAENVREGQTTLTNRNLSNIEMVRTNIDNRSFTPGQVVNTGSQVNTGSPNFASIPSSQFSSPTNNILPLLNQLLESVIIPLNIGANSKQIDDIVQVLKYNLANDKEFMRSLVLIKDILQQRVIPGVDKALINTLVSNIEDMEREFVGQRVFNVMTKFSGDSNLNYYYLSFPVKIGEEYRLCQLKIDKKLGSKALIDQDNVKIVVSLETGNLGYVLFHVDWYKKGLLKLQGVVETEEVSNYISANVNGLIEALEGRGYVVDYEGIKVASDEEEQMRVQLQEVDEVIKPYVIDIRI